MCLCSTEDEHGSFRSVVSAGATDNDDDYDTADEAHHLIPKNRPRPPTVAAPQAGQRPGAEEQPPEDDCCCTML